MAAADKKDKNLARRLAVYLAEEGEGAVAGVRDAIAKVCASRHAARRRSFIRIFLRLLARELRAREILIEHAGPLSAAETASIKTSFESLAGRALGVQTRENAELIAGVCVTLGDNRYDASVAGQLERLSLSVN